jgi:hypothetical protein
VFECDAQTLGGLITHCELVEGVEKQTPATPPAPTKVAHRRSDGLFDVYNITIKNAVSEKPLTEAEAAAIADAFAPANEKWTDIEYEGQKPFFIQKIEGAAPGTPSFNVIERATGKPVNPEPVTKAVAKELLTEKLEG